MTTYGLTSTGFVTKTLTDAKTEIEESLRAAFGASIDLSPSGPFGQLAGIMADRSAEVWDLAQATNSAFDPDTATGTFLDSLLGLTGARRLEPAKSTVIARFSGTPGTVVASGRALSVVGTGARFVTTEGGTIDAFGYLSVEAQSEDFGPIVANAGTLTVIETPIAGVPAVTNPEDAKLGTLTETDSEARIRRVLLLRGSGSAAADAIRARVLEVAGVQSVTVFENDTSSTDSDGLPPKSVEVLVLGGEEDEIRSAILASKTAGIEAYGLDSGTVVDAHGRTRTVPFSRPAESNVWLALDVIVDPNVFPLDGETQIRDAVIAWGLSTLSTGRDVPASAVAAQAFKVDGVLEVTQVRIGTVNPPVSSATLSVGIRGIARLDTARIAINITEGVP